MPPPPSNRSPLPALGLLLVGSAGIAAVWVVLARFSGGGQMSWFAVLAALDAALMLRLGRMHPGLPRAAWAVFGTCLAIAMANWGIVAAQIGAPMGLLPWESLARLGPGLGWTLTMLVNDRADFAWWCAALVVATVAAR